MYKNVVLFSNRHTVSNIKKKKNKHLSIINVITPGLINYYIKE